jgi:probable O-glycosylation ligase (exosortase A-associated)
MREIVLIFVVSCLCVAAPLYPLWGLFGWVWFALCRPDALAFSFRQYSLFIVIFTFLGSVRYLGRIAAVFQNPFSAALVALQVPLAASVVFGRDPALAWDSYSDFLRMFAVLLLIPMLCQTLDQIRWLIVVMAFSIGTIGLKFGLWGVLQGGARFVNGYYGMMSDNNTLALGLVMAVPLCWYARELVDQKHFKWMFLAMAFFSMMAVIMTYSRGGFLAISVVLLVLFIRAKRKILVGVALTAGVAVTVFLLGQTYLDRVSTIATPDEEGSAVSRMALARLGLRMGLDHPIGGVGFGDKNEQMVMEEYMAFEPDLRTTQVIHNNYLQIWVESGVSALLLYCGLLFGGIFWCSKVTRFLVIRAPRYAGIPQAIQVSMIGFAVGSLFLSRVQFDFIYMLFVACGALHLVVRSMMEQERRDAAEQLEAGVIPNSESETAVSYQY